MQNQNLSRETPPLIIPRNAFISYRTSGGLQLAGLMANELSRRGLEVFYDRRNNMVGEKFPHILMDNIEKSDIFILVLSPSCFQNQDTKSKKDWYLNEILCAIELHKPIIPSFADGFSWHGPDNQPPEEIAKSINLEEISAVEFPAGRENEGFDQLYAAVKKMSNPKGRKVVTIGGIEYGFRWCPAGNFSMGSETPPCDGPVHQVTLTQGFWMLETPVTQEMWSSVMGSNPSRFKLPNHPVENVNWHDCQKFCERLRKEGFKVSLPTEAQWEYACRAGTKGNFNGNLNEIAWYGEKYISGSTHPVGQKLPNAWKLYDMLGNVMEWCADIYGEYRSDSVTNPTGACIGPYRVYRGGYWYGTAEECRSTLRKHRDSSFYDKHLGFRIILTEN